MNRQYWADTFSIEFRSLGLFRIGIGLILICDLLSRIIFGLDLVSPNGVIPFDQALHALEGKSTLSLYLLFENQLFFNFLIALSFISYGCYLIGYRARLFGALSLILLFSIQNRNPFVLHGGDILLRIFLLLSLFLPIDAFSFDSRWKSRAGRYASFATLALFIQIGLMYFFSVLYKSGPEWQDGSALFYAFQLDWISNSTGQSLARFPALLKMLTYGTLALEFLVLPLTFINFKRPYFRWFLFLSLFIFHLGIFVTMDIGTFPFVCMLASCIFYPGSVARVTSDFSFNGKNTAALGIMILAITCNVIFFLRPAGLSQAKSFMINSGLYQKWSMFSPSPAKSNVTFEVITNTSSADNNVKKIFPGHHWQKFLMQVSRSQNSELLHLFSQYLCRTTRAPHIQITLQQQPLGGSGKKQEFPLILKNCDASHAI